MVVEGLLTHGWLLPLIQDMTTNVKYDTPVLYDSLFRLRVGATYTSGRNEVLGKGLLARWNCTTGNNDTLF